MNKKRSILTIMEEDEKGNIRHVSEKDATFIRVLASMVNPSLIAALVSLRDGGHVVIERTPEGKLHTEGLPNPMYMVTGFYVGMLETLVAGFGIDPELAKTALNEHLTQLCVGSTVIQGEAAERFEAGKASGFSTVKH